MSAPASRAAARLPSPHAKTFYITTSLANAGWGDLDGRHLGGVRATLRGLVDTLPWGSGQGLATASQIATRASLSERWVRRCLGILEDAGLITWHRGGVLHGKPRPSWFRIDRAALIALIGGARPVLAAIEARRAERTAARLAGLRFVRGHSPRSRRSAHAALSASPHPQGGGPNASDPPLEQELSRDQYAQAAKAGAARLRALMDEHRRGRRTS